MSYYNRYKSRKRFNNGGNGANGIGNGEGNGNGNAGGKGDGDGPMQAGLSVPDAIFDIGKNKRVTVRQFRNINLIDIREYYMDNSSNEMRPGKKGISLTEDLYDEFLKHRLNIDEALRRLGSKRPRTKTIVISSDDEDDYGADNKDDSGSKKDSTEGSKDNSKEARAAAKAAKAGENDDENDKSKENDEPREKKRKKGDKKNPAGPSLLITEEKKHLEEREANAVLVVPHLATPAVKQEPAVIEEETFATLEEPQQPVKALQELEPVTVSNNQVETEQVGVEATRANTNDSSDEDFAKHLDDEMSKAADEVSEEE
ncbi:hypothetical protein TPHA_0N01490 [Tetrapisispora phaffii CBS 4417]|uniref:Transcriptional coactivator p15 (PC4) C-terminal domain-containing protein n=1 Tax=Tetrapisispora phaffii (strain ATCC 24235 / CBS 4417 / NBRC 1672 / NRRL Y-8282 / UCD 70-5) TaxID=1071381 RepID=G8C1A2_TETPH|nr:hypothetical protein TPHA_0N01490 [Tetrapisispora phaffii CBS 4417]CCE65930.1 hypothetical protein TPHA_0N01490 [Tetrapisispora phaffii CBS 4417]